MPYGISLKKIMGVITRVHISDNLIIILLGISLFLRWISWIALDRFFSFCATYKPCDLGKVPSILGFLNVFIICKKEDIMQWNSTITLAVIKTLMKNLEEQRWMVPQPQYSFCSFSLHLAAEMRFLRGFWNHCHYAGRISQPKGPELSPLILKLECTLRGAQVTSSQAGTRMEFDQKAWPLELLACELGWLTSPFQ